LFVQSYREQPLEVDVMVTVEQFCDVCMKNLKMIVVGNNPDEDFIWCKCLPQSLVKDVIIVVF